MSYFRSTDINQTEKERQQCIQACGCEVSFFSVGSSCDYLSLGRHYFWPRLCCCTTNASLSVWKGWQWQLKQLVILKAHLIGSELDEKNIPQRKYLFRVEKIFTFSKMKTKSLEFSIQFYNRKIVLIIDIITICYIVRFVRQQGQSLFEWFIHFSSVTRAQFPKSKRHSLSGDTRFYFAALN